MKTYIHTDLEGISGIDTMERLDARTVRRATDCPLEFHP